MSNDNKNKTIEKTPSYLREGNSLFNNLRDLFNKRIVLKDGAVGTVLQKRLNKLYIPILELLNAENSQLVLDLHLEYLDAGADIITTNSFSGHPIELRRYGLESRTYELNFKSAEIARKAIKQSGKQAFIAGSVGPTSLSLLLSKGETDFDSLKDGYKIQIRALIDGGADYILIETIHDPLNAKAASVAFCEIIEEGYKAAVAFSLTVNLNGLSLSGQTVSSFVVSFSHMNPLYLGLNCSLGPESLRGALEEIHEESPFPVAIVPNAGLPDENLNFKISPDEFADQIRNFLEKGWVNLVGGCCGTTPAHIGALKRLIDRYKPREYRGDIGGKIAGLDSVSTSQVPSPMIVGERANTLGSKKFKTCVEEKNHEKVVEIIRQQERSGAHAIDICFASRDYDEISFWKTYTPLFAPLIRVPVFIDSTNLGAIEEALKLLPGKPVINSVNLEDGGRHIKQIAKILKKYPAKVIAGLISQKGMAKTFDEKNETANLLFETLLSCEIPPYDIILDTLVFPISTGVHPQETIKAIIALKKNYPECKTVLGISNISFGLPKPSRGILNSLYLKMAIDAGLDIAIVNINELTRSEILTDEIRALALSALSDNDQKALSLLIEKTSKEAPISAGRELSSISTEERICLKIIRGIRDGIEDDIKSLLKNLGPMEIINGPLMKSMDRVGQMFADGKIIISEVLLSAEVFRQAIKILMEFTEKAEIHPRGKIILATVKGDVHDIGKNLVGMILESHGFNIVDLGTQVTPEKLIESVIRENPIAVGLSGLLIRSAHIMRETAEMFADAGLSVPLVVGGAALTEEFTQKNIEPAYRGNIVRYAKDAIDGLKIFKEIFSGEIHHPVYFRSDKMIENDSHIMKSNSSEVASKIIPRPPDYLRHVLSPILIDEVLPYLNWNRLIRKHMGAKGEKEIVVRERLQNILNKVKDERLIIPKAVFGFFMAYKICDEIILVDPNKTELGRLRFKRLSTGTCLSDFISNDIGEGDNIALMVTTAGSVEHEAKRMREENQLLLSYALESFAIEIAEATAARVHDIIRDMWGIRKEQGKRFSPGYNSIPDLEMQKIIFDLLNPSEIGVYLTDEFMMKPEASVSAVVFHDADNS